MAKQTQDMDKFLTIRMSTAMYDELSDMARRNHRTLAGAVRHAIQEQIDAETEEVAA